MLVPPDPEEGDILAGFKARFDDLQRDTHESALADEALRWLEQQVSPDGFSLGPLVIYQHSNRKRTEAAEFAEEFARLRRVSDRLIGFAGALQTLRSYAVAVAVAYTAFVVYGSLVPLRPQTLDWHAAVERFQAGLTLSQSISRADFVANFFLFLPLSFMWLGTLCLYGSRAVVGKSLFILLACVALGFGIEFVQIWYPPRISALSDVLAQLLGALLGIGLWLISGRALIERVSGFLPRIRGLTNLEWLLLVYVFGLAIYALSPLDLTISVTDIGGKFREGKLHLVPFRHLDSGQPVIARIVSWSIRLLAFVPIGALVTRFRIRDRKIRSVGFAAGSTAVLGSLLEIGKVFVLSAIVDTTNIVLAGVGGAIGGWIAHRRLFGAAASAESDSSSELWGAMWQGVRRVLAASGLLDPRRLPSRRFRLGGHEAIGTQWKDPRGLSPRRFRPFANAPESGLVLACGCGLNERANATPLACPADPGMIRYHGRRRQNAYLDRARSSAVRAGDS